MPIHVTIRNIADTTMMKYHTDAAMLRYHSLGITLLSCEALALATPQSCVDYLPYPEAAIHRVYAVWPVWSVNMRDVRCEIGGVNQSRGGLDGLCANCDLTLRVLLRARLQERAWP